MQSQREWTIGKNRARLEESNVLFVKMDGDTGLDEARALVNIYRELGTRKPFFLLVDVTGTNVDEKARKHFTQELQPEWFLGVVYVGAGMVERAFSKALAVALYFTGRWKTEFLFAKTMEEARAKLDRLREKQVAVAS